MTIRTPTTNANPLRALPSALAIADIQGAVLAATGGVPRGEDELVALLQMDPLAVSRGLRAAHAPVFRQSRSLPSVRDLVRSLGNMSAGRLLTSAPVPVAADSPLRTLWRHSVATAMAAEELATRSGMLDPQAAYLAGLLLQLPLWLQWLRTATNAPQFSAGEWIAHWQLPSALVGLLHAARSLNVETAPSVVSMMTMPDLIAVARRLAHLADYPAPESRPLPPLTKIDRVDQEVAERLRERFQLAMAKFGLDQNGNCPPTAAAPEPQQDGAVVAPNRSLEEIVVGILRCSRSESYRGIITALAAAALRYGGYDRAFFAKWNPQTGMMTLRAKADSSSRRMKLLQHRCSAVESQALRTAVAEDEPIRLEALPRGSPGLLTGLSTDELLAVPLNGDFQLPAFLLLDRAITLAPIDLNFDLIPAITLGQTGTLLNENLLLRRRQQRAQKFALTDPLTHLFNRRMGLVTLDQEVARAERSSRPLTVLMCDLDHFKQLNDSLGHIQGDHALRATADVLRQTLRKSDTICRYGGEEFLLVLPDTTPAEATVLAARLFTSVHQRGEELGMPISISIGLTLHRAGDTSEMLLQRADHALFASKGYGRNRFSADIDSADVDPSAMAPATEPNGPAR